MQTTKALIPTSGVHVTHSRNGFLVAKYDRHGLCASPRWFATDSEAHRYAQTLVQMARDLDMEP